MLPKVKDGGGSVMVYAAISWCSILLAILLSFIGRITARECVDRLSNQVHSMIQTLFPNNDAVFKVDNAPTHTAGTVQLSHGLKSMKVNFNIIPGQHNHQI
jgi:fumarate reductase subunit D